MFHKIHYNKIGVKQSNASSKGIQSLQILYVGYAFGLMISHIGYASDLVFGMLDGSFEVFSASNIFFNFSSRVFMLSKVISLLKPSDFRSFRF